MRLHRRWDPCIAHRGKEVETFILRYFGQSDRRVLLVAGAGFDPRTCDVAKCLRDAVQNMDGLLIKENRPGPPTAQSEQADANTETLLATLPQSQVVPIEIFDTDNAVVGGRSVMTVLSRQSLTDLTDVAIDISALSVGTSFPIIRYFVEYINREQLELNLHLFVVHNPHLDAAIRSIPSDVPGYVHGFKGGSTLYDSGNAARLWLPQLTTGRRGAFGQLFDFVAPHDTCPILPFPARDPRLGDLLAEEYLTELESSWSVDTRNIVYADESDPLDLYQTVLRLDDRRKPVFVETGGSMLVLSPLGSKVMALGALMAALERDLPVAHLEPIGYEYTWADPAKDHGSDLIHVWLEGDVYPQPRPAFPSSAGIA